MLIDEVKNAIAPLRDELNLIITIGNDFRSDDGVGPYIFEKITGEPENIVVINAGDKPENIIDEAVSVNPKKTIIFDAADFGGMPGEVRVVPEDLIPDVSLSTHTFPPKIIAKILEEDTKSQVFFIGIQPKSLKFGQSLSKEVKNTADEIVNFITKVF